MTDKEIIEKYLNRYYRVILATSYSGITPKTEFMLSTVNGKTKFLFAELERELKVIFGSNHFHFVIARDWFTNSVKKLIGGFDEFLAECSVVLGVSNWIIVHKEFGEIKPDSITRYCDEKVITVKHLLDKWYDEKVIEASEKMMRNF